MTIPFSRILEALRDGQPHSGVWCAARADEIEAALAASAAIKEQVMLAARHAGAREAFNTIRNLVEMKAGEVSQERPDPEWLARMAGA